MIAVALVSLAILGAPAAQALCVGTACATASISYSCTGVNCAFDAGGGHSGSTIVAGALEVEGTAIPAGPLNAVCQGVGGCTTAIGGLAAASGCAVATAETTDLVFKSSDVAFDCDPSTLALVERLIDRIV